MKISIKNKGKFKACWINRLSLANLAYKNLKEILWAKAKENLTIIAICMKKWRTKGNLHKRINNWKGTGIETVYKEPL
jgi:hypothetical protein